MTGMTVIAGLMVTGVTRISGMTRMSSLGRLILVDWNGLRTCIHLIRS